MLCVEKAFCHILFPLCISFFSACLLDLQEVEREISFRTECGLYYSYYKQMLKAPSIQQGTVCS